jgi:perosamine synthetase
MTNICAAIGLAQLEQASHFLEKKRLIAKKYRDTLEPIGYSFQIEKPDIVNSYWMCSILAENETKRDLLRTDLMKVGIETRPVFYPVHTMPMYASKFQIFNIAENIGCRGINLPSWPGMADDEINFVIESIIKLT